LGTNNNTGSEFRTQTNTPRNRRTNKRTNLDSEFSGVVAYAEHLYSGRAESGRSETVAHPAVQPFVGVTCFQPDDDRARRRVLDHVYLKRRTTHEHRFVVVRIDYVYYDCSGAGLGLRSSVRLSVPYPADFEMNWLEVL